MYSSMAAGGQLLIRGNGGSAADAQHIAAELTGRFFLEQCPFRALALHANASSLTAVGNNYGYEHVFARELTAHVLPAIVVCREVGNTPVNSRTGVVGAARSHCACRPGISFIQRWGTMWLLRMRTWDGKARAVTRVLHWAVRRCSKPDFPPPKSLGTGVGSSRQHATSHARQELRDYARERHSWDVVGEMTRNVYAQLMGRE